MVLPEGDLCLATLLSISLGLNFLPKLTRAAFQGLHGFPNFDAINFDAFKDTSRVSLWQY